MRFRHTAGLYAVLILALAAFTGTAVAGNGHGNGGGNGGGHDQAAAQPAQPVQSSTPTTQSASTQSSSTQSSNKQSSPHERKHEDKHQSASSAAATTSDNSTGVKPSSSTHKDTHELASSNKTKQYGNGQTAGQIATKAGYGNATLHGPGNSQPHKTGCGSHEVDVHALKSNGSKCGATEKSHEAKAHVSTSHQSKVHVSHESKVHVSKSHESKSHEKAAEHVTVETEKSQTKGVSASAHLHVTICHATGSASHPFVVISPSASGVFHGHLGHQDGRDIVPAFTWNGTVYSQNWTAAGQAMFAAGCNTAATAVQTEEKGHVETTTTTTTAVTPVVVTTTVATSPAASTATASTQSPTAAS